MTVRKKFIVGFSAVFCLFLVWYFFVKESDYSISFKVNAATGTVFQGIEEWSGARILMDNEKYVTLEKRNFDFIKQNMKSKNAEFEYEWDIKTMNDSIAKVTVAIKDLNHSLYNKLTVPFFNTSFKEEQIKKVKDLKEGLIKHIEKYKVRIEGEGESKEIFVAYLSLKSVLQEKAQKMIMTDADITGFLYSHKIEIIGKPFVEITNWNLDKETIDFNYCFPVDKNTKIIEDKVVKFKVLPAVKGLKATYYGNFRTSDRAWFRLLDYAKNHGYKLNNKPLENFLANPFNGGDELKWETKIIIPFDKK
jgi:effector-binding domain-containing protein